VGFWWYTFIYIFMYCIPGNNGIPLYNTYVPYLQILPFDIAAILKEHIPVQSHSTDPTPFTSTYAFLHPRLPQVPSMILYIIYCDNSVNNSSTAKQLALWRSG
jgi:hypothetical protein